jgi:dipeptidyl aminopeptidase/acylaminoacyl peptidase
MYKKPWHPMIPFLLQNLLGGSPETSRQAYRNASPVNFISTTSPPTLIFHGRKDRTVNISQSELLQKKLQATGVKNKLVVYDRAAHGWYGALLSDSYDKIESFLKSLL